MPTAAFIPRRSSARTFARLRMPPAAVMGSCVARRSSRNQAQIRAAHGAFGVHIGAQKLRGVASQVPENFLRTQAQLFLPAANQDVPAVGIHRDDDALASDARGQPREKCAIHRAAAKRRAATIIFSAPASRMRAARAAVRIPPPTRTRIGARRQSCAHQARVASLPHGGVEIDHVEQRIFAEALEQAENVVDGEAPLAAVHELHGAAVLQVDAGNDHDPLRVSVPHRRRLCAQPEERFEFAEALDRRREKSKRPARRPRGLRRTRRENPRACPRRPRRSPAR